MTLQSLNPPQDITWRRMAYSRDMIDTNFADMAFPPKWRSSLTVYYYVVPEEETVDAYPDMRVVYLKLVASITGWNPSEDLLVIKKEAAAANALDDLQTSIWDAVEASGWASKYWACHGAILSLGIFPGKDDTVDPDDYPYISDFEPKKRELYEAVTEGDEVLSGSSNKSSTTKGTTSVESQELNGFSLGVGAFKIGAEGKYGGSTTTVDQNVTDTLREARETQSRSTSTSQMYQLFNGYHVGTNRAVFVISPRPHSVTGSFNLLDGERKLEGLQDVFLVAAMPRSLQGFCIQASIDTGHKHPDDMAVVPAIRATFALRTGEFSDPPCLGGMRDPILPPDGGGGGGGGGGGTTPPDDTSGFSFVVTRRTIQACGVFGDNDTLELVKVSSPPDPRPHFTSEVFIPSGTIGLMARTAPQDPTEGGFDDCRQTIARTYNRNIAHMSRTMVDLFSSGSATPKRFGDTKTFKALFLDAATRLPLTLEDLRRLDYITPDEYNALAEHRVWDLSDLYQASADRVEGVDIASLRSRIVDKRR